MKGERKMRKKLRALMLIPFLLFYALPAGAVEKEGRKWQDESIYFIMVDRFHNGSTKNDFKVNVNDPKAYNGGDFKGIMDKLDYIKGMGFTAIMLTPVFDNEERGYHGYWVSDFYNTEEHFGTLDEFKTLVKEAHKRDMKVILDFVVNHVGPNHPWVHDPEKKDWFHEKKPIVNWDNHKELENNWLFGLPDLNQDNPETRKYLLDAAKWWMKETDVDGYRLDAVQHVPKDFWSDFSKEVKSVKKDFYLLGDVKDHDLRAVASYQDSGIDGFLDYSQNKLLRTAFARPDQSFGDLFASIDEYKTNDNRPELLGTFLDHHDMPRFTQDIIQYKQNPGTRWKMALTYLYTVPGIPIVYYGSEIALAGGEEPDNRRLMGFKADKEIIDYVTKLGELRQELPALTRGDFELLHKDGGLAVFKRTYKEETIIVAINNTSKSQNITIDSEKIEPGKELRGLLEGDLVREQDGKYTLIIDREKAEIYALAEKTGINISYLLAMGSVYAAFIAFIVVVWKRSKRKSE